MTTAASEYVFERLSEKHYKDLQFLFQHCFNRNVAADYFVKKFDTKQFGVQHLGYLAYTKDGFPAAFYGLYPLIMHYQQKDYLSAVSGDSMTHENHRRKGLFDLLAKMTYELAQALGVKFLYCFPNQYTLPGSKKIGWEYVPDEMMLTYSIKVKTLPIAKICRKNSILNQLYKGYVKLILGIFSKSGSPFQNSLKNSSFGYILHDSNYFAYKSYTDTKLVKLAGNSVWLKVDGELKIGDIDSTEPTAILDTINKLKSIAFFIGCQELQTTVCKESFIHNALSQKYIGFESFCIGRINFGIDFPKENVRFIMSDFDSF
jgi:hypothetical protein